MLLPLCLVIAVTLPLTATNETSLPPKALSEQSLVHAAAQDILRTDSVLLKPIQENRQPQWYISPYQAMANMPHNIGEYEHASGNWFGYRDGLDARGIEFSVTYTSDIAGNPVGGKTPGGFTYTDNFAFGCFVETEKLLGWHGGYFMLSGLQRDGNSLSQQNIGNQFTVQQVFGGQTFHFYELSYQQDFWDDHASLKTGRIAAGNDFATSPLYWLYMNNGIDGNPQAVPVNGKFSCYPNATWGSRLKVDLPASMVARLGVYQATPQNSVQGVNWDFYPSNGVMLVGQYGWNPEFFKPASSLADADHEKEVVTSSLQKNASQPSPKNSVKIPAPKGFTGHYWMGGYYSSMEYAQFNSAVKTPNAYGLYWHADQTVYQPNPRSDEGLILWSAYVLSPQQNISLMPFEVNAGAIYTGLIPGRSNDFSIFGVAYGNFSTSYAGVQEQAGNGNRTYELVYEWGYRVQLTKFAYFQPDLQWVINPAGTSAIPNALVLGAQMGVVF